VTARLRVVGAEKTPPPPDGFSVLELDCRRCGGEVTALRWPGGKWTLVHECWGAPRTLAQRFVEWRWAPDVVRGAFALLLVAMLAGMAWMG
jgi:hypothetical protein